MKIAPFLLFAPLLVAQIRPNTSGVESIQLKNNQIEAEGATLKQLIQVAFKTPGTRINGPEWIGEKTYDVPSMSRETLRQALADQFKLKTRTDNRPIPVYVLTAAPGSEAKLTTAPAAMRAHDGDVHLTGKRLTITSIASALSQHLNQPVIDETGLQGHYDVDLAFDPDAGDLIGLVRSRLGLELKHATRPMDVLVIEHAEPLQ